jgi:hypothetical protein
MKSFNKNLVSVFTDERGNHKVILPSGEVIPHLIKTVTTDDVEIAVVEFKMICNVVATKEDALQKYKAE